MCDRPSKYDTRKRESVELNRKPQTKPKPVVRKK